MIKGRLGGEKAEKNDKLIISELSSSYSKFHYAPFFFCAAIIIFLGQLWNKG